MRRALVLTVLALLVPLAPATAEAGIPSYQDRLDAKRFARDFWGDLGYQTRCAGVRFRWRNYAEDYAIRGGLAYQRGCTITFNKQVKWGYMPRYGWGDDWWRFCATAIHEYGHLLGVLYDGHHLAVRGAIHTRNPNSIMAHSEPLNYHASWWPHFPACRYQGDDEDDDGLPDYRELGSAMSSARSGGL